MVGTRSSIGLWLTLGLGLGVRVWGNGGKPKDRTIHSLGSQVLQMPPEHNGHPPAEEKKNHLEESLFTVVLGYHCKTHGP